MKDFKQIAKENHISRQTIYNRIARIPNFKNEHLTKQNGKWLVDDKGVKLLDIHKAPFRPKHYKRRNGFVKQDYINEVHILRKKLNQRDKVIANLSYSFKHLANRSEPQQKQLTAPESTADKKIQDYQSQINKNDLTLMKKRINGNWLLRFLYKHSK